MKLCSSPLSGHRAERRNYGAERCTFTERKEGQRSAMAHSASWNATFWYGNRSRMCFPVREMNNVRHSGTEFSAKSAFRFVKQHFLQKNAAFRCRIFNVMCFPLRVQPECAFRSAIAAFRSVNTARKAALFQKLETSFTTGDRVLKNSLQITGWSKNFKNRIRNMKLILLYPPMALTHNFFRETVPLKKPMRNQAGRKSLSVNKKKFKK